MRKEFTRELIQNTHFVPARKTCKSFTSGLVIHNGSRGFLYLRDSELYKMNYCFV